MPIDDPESMNIVRHLFANSNLMQIESYVRRGRAFEDLDLAELEERYVQGMTIWADADGNPDFQEAANDAEAEYALRRLDPPIGLVVGQISKVNARVREFLQKITPDRAMEINDDLLARYDRSVLKRN